MSTIKKFSDDEKSFLQRNLLLIRETYTLLYSGKYGMTPFYDAIGISSDTLTGFLIRHQLSENSHKVISKNLHSYGVEKSSLRLSNALEFDMSDDIVDAMDIYFDENAEKDDKDFALRTIRAFIAKSYFENDKSMIGVVTVCNNIVSRNADFIENDLAKAYDVLETLDEIDFSKINVKSRQFPKYITKLAEHVGSVENEFDNFYTLVQQMKEQKTPQSLMNEIYNNLNTLNNMTLTKDDAKSDSCIFMLKEITETVKNIYSKM